MNEIISLAIFFIAFGVADGVGIVWEYVQRAAASVTNVGTTTADRDEPEWSDYAWRAGMVK